MMDITCGEALSIGLALAAVCIAIALVSFSAYQAGASRERVKMNEERRKGGGPA
jgi:hypothetical protein